jgi:putative salt-induced outer membrane protein
MSTFLLSALFAASQAPVLEAVPIVTILDVPPPPYIPMIAPPPPPPPPRFPLAVRRMIEEAIAAGDEKSVSAVVRFAKTSVPAAAEEIEAMHDDFQRRMRAKKEAEARAAREALEAAGPFEYWDGQAELGASRSTGNTENLGVYASMSGKREGLQWRHKFIARAELQKTNGVTTTERVLLSWQPNYKFDDRLYAFGLSQYEHDHRAGFDSRFTGGAGVGYGVIASSAVKLDLEGGPTLRYTDESENGDSLEVAGRASLNLKWKLSPTLELTQDSALFYDAGDSSASALTAIDTQVLSALKARFSYHLLYEGDAPEGTKSLDTVTRATLVYSF